MQCYLEGMLEVRILSYLHCFLFPNFVNKENQWVGMLFSKQYVLWPFFFFFTEIDWGHNIYGSIIIKALCCAVSLVTQSVESLQPHDCSPPGSSVQEILQASLLEWVAMPSSRGSSQPRNQTGVSCIVARFFTSWATRESLKAFCFSFNLGAKFGWGIRKKNDF